MRLSGHLSRELLAGTNQVPVRILLIDNDEDDYRNINAMLTGTEGALHFLEWAPSYRSGVELLMEGRHDLYLVAYHLEDKNGLDFIREAQGVGCTQPIIILDGDEDREADIEAMQLGAWDYLSKDRLDSTMLERTIRYTLEHKKVLDVMLESQRQREKFVATLTHDLKTPIKAEYRIFELMLTERFGPLNDEQKLVINEMLRSNRFMYQMVDNLLTAFKFEEGQMILRMDTLDLNELVSSTISIDLSGLAQDKDQRLSLDLQEDMPPIPVDALEIKRVIYNLVQNAINYTPNGGEIRIYSRYRDHQALITVADTGPGIEEAIQKSLFEPYASTAKRYRHIGTGLGLYISRKIIEAHQGELRVVSRLGEGSQFTFSLPDQQSEKSRYVSL